MERELELPVGVEPVVGPIEAEPQSQPTGPMVEVLAGEFVRGTDSSELSGLLAGCRADDVWCEQGALA
ncbi:MAG TPA: hypothetical protein VK034_18615, partial [Enhygromyxa sp.]|nr:hypothetical protein [Enhygromyxa sp.]